MKPATARFQESPNAHSKSITRATGTETYGILNQHSAKNLAYEVGVSEDKGVRRTMEDAHSFVTDYAGVRGQGFFAVFDGHAGKHAAEWCGANFHEYLLDTMRTTPGKLVPDMLNETFHNVDLQLSKMCEESQGKIHSGCTAVTAFLRVEDADGKQSFLPEPLDTDSFHSSKSTSSITDGLVESPINGLHTKSASMDGMPPPDQTKTESGTSSKKSTLSAISGKGSRIRRALKGLTSSGSGGGNVSGASSPNTPRSQSPSLSTFPDIASPTHTPTAPIVSPPEDARRVLYCANAGDARGVLCRAGKAVRLTYDHKGSDKQEAKRITDAGGFVMSGRVNGVLAVTRSLGDSSMKDFVVGAPYTTETELCEEDEFLILACDGLWDVCSDQHAVELIRRVEDAQEASQLLIEHASDKNTTDNVTVIVIRLKNGIDPDAAKQ